MKVMWNRFAAAALCVITANVAQAADKDIVDTAVSAGNFKTLVAAAQAADLVGALQGKGPLTVFAPTDDAFAKLPAGTVDELLKPENKDKLTAVLTYHVVPGKVMVADVVKLSGAKTLNGQRIDVTASDEGVGIDNANVVAADVECANGVIHVIDSVILPASDTIPATAEKAGSFGTLLAAVKAAGLDQVLSGDGPFTVFAPTDEAFAKLPAGTVESLLKPESRQKLVDILKYHVVSGRVYSDDALTAGSAGTLEGSPVTISADASGARVDSAKLIKTDLDSSNGVIHVIDSVLMPPLKNADARRMLETTVAQGAALYNSGHHSQCACMYEASMSYLISTGVQGVSSCSHSRMSETLTAATQEHDPSRKAWMLRHSIDQMYSQLVSSKH